MGVFSEDHVADFAKKHKNTQFSPFRLDESISPLLVKELFFTGSPRRFLRLGFLYLICDQCEKNATQLSSAETKSFRNTVLSSISESFQGEITMKDLARSLGYEYHYFSQLFHKHFKMNFKDFLNVFRFERACELLSKKDCSITEVYEKCGFSSLRNFNRVFKELSGVTPHTYQPELWL